MCKSILFLISLIIVPIFTRQRIVTVYNNGETYKAHATTLYFPNIFENSDEFAWDTETESSLPAVGTISTLKILRGRFGASYSLCDEYHPTLEDGDYVTGKVIKVE